MFARIRDNAAAALSGLFGAPYGFFDQMEQAGALPSVDGADAIDFSVFLRDIDYRTPTQTLRKAA